MISRIANSLRNSIVLSLRVSLGLLLVATIVIGWFASRQLTLIAERKADLTDRALPLLSETRRLGTLLLTQSEQLIALGDFSVEADLASFAAATAGRKSEVDDSIARLASLSPGTDLSGTADTLFEKANAIVLLKVDRRELEQRRLDQLERIDDLLNQMEARIEGFRLDLQSRLQQDINGLRDRPDSAAIILPVTRELDAVYQLGFRLEAMKETTRQLDPNVSGVSSGLSQTLYVQFREILALVLRYRRAARDQDMAASLAELRRLISGEGGLLATVEDLTGLRVQIDEAVADSQVLVGQISATIDQFSAATESDAEGTLQLLEDSFGAIVRYSLLVFVFYVGGFLLISYGVVERRLNQRIKPLNSAVRALARRNYDKDIPVTGQDELGAIADALRAAQSTAQDLDRSNTDLQAFAYAASHDLKAPMRAIMDLASWTLEDAGDMLSDESRQSLRLLRKRAQRLANLVDGLLAYARVDGADAVPAMLNLPAECTEIMEIVDPDQRFTLKVESEVEGWNVPITPLRQILNNLLVNAMKHHDQETGTIIVRAVSWGKFIVVSVADDGPGVEEKYRERIFELFEKLESRDKVEGSGIGLALVKRLAERHGSGIHVEPTSEDGRGATFVVSLRAEPPVYQKVA